VDLARRRIAALNLWRDHGADFLMSDLPEGSEAMPDALMRDFLDEVVRSSTAHRDQLLDGPEDTESRRVVVVDDDRVLLRLLEAFIASTPGLRLAGQAMTAAGAVGMVIAELPDIVVLDYQLDHLTADKVIELIGVFSPGTRVLLHSARDDIHKIGMRLGVARTVHKGDDVSRLVEALALLGRVDESRRDDAAVGEGEPGLIGDGRDQAGDQRDMAGVDRDQAGDQRDLAGIDRDEAGHRRDHDADERDQAADQRDLVADDRDLTARRRDVSAGQRDDAGMRRDAAGLSRDGIADRRDRAAEIRDLEAEEFEETLDVTNPAAAAARRRSVQARVDAASDRAGASTDRGAGAGDRVNSDADRDVARADRQASARARDNAELDRDRALADRVSGADGRTDSDADRDSASADRWAGATERTDAEHDRGSALADRGASARERGFAALDGLTGVHLRGPGFAGLEREMMRAARTGEPMVVAFVDVDGLKTINDQEGHAAGDQTLVQVASVLVALLRSYDLVIRYGGDEFLCVLPGMVCHEAVQRLDRVRAAVAEQAPGRSVSVGIAEHWFGDSPDSLVARADAALYSERRRLRGS